MRVYRLCRAPFRALDGEGARLYGGRWNAPGRPVIYASGSLALAALEYLVQVDVEDVPADLVALTLHVPDDVAVETIDPGALPAGWERAPEPAVCRALGDAWLGARRALVLRVPSAPVPEEPNVLLDPRHPDAGRIGVVAERPFHYDPRLLG